MSTKVIDVKRIEETVLWKKIEQLNDGKAVQLVTAVKVLCEEASDRMKAMSATSPQYTLHDESHFLRVTEIMAMVLGETKEQLNSIELCLLILSAYYHDQGMVMDEAEYSKLTTDTKFQIFRENWYLDHPNRKEIYDQLQSPTISDEEKHRLVSLLAEMEAAMLTDYLRTTHANRSARLIIEKYSTDHRLEIFGVNLAHILAMICESHYSHTHELIPSNGFNYDVQIGLYKINLSFIAIILRLADILDFDADRTPDVLLNTIHFSSPISLIEWRKHQGIIGWEINENNVRFSANYPHPAYHAAALKFMDWVDKELSECQNLCNSFPAQFQRYKLQLPRLVDRSRIKPLNNSYIFHDFEITLSRNEIVKLLMTDKLYNQPYICIRELLQNSLDALRYRKALFACSDNIEWSKGKIDFLHTIDKDGYEIIQCKDNGSGMDRDIITRFFTKAGRSFYRSPEFERERAIFKHKNIDYDPCSQFGIGFMSCFMLGDRIKIETRRDYGYGKNSGEPLIIEINGLGGLIVIRKGLDSQEIGTTVTITSRQKPSFLDEWNDKVLLTTVLKHFAVATEFPILGRCEIEELHDTVEIPTSPSYIPTLLENAEINPSYYITIEENFTDINHNLGGIIRESFLINTSGIPCLSTPEVTWKAEGGIRKMFNLFKSDETIGGINEASGYEQSQISIDGIHLCGVAGRPQWQNDPMVKMRLGNRPTHIFASPYALDARGNLKPEITPAREPVEHHGFHSPTKWNVLSQIVAQASGKIWTKLLADFSPKGLDSESYLKLLIVYRANLLQIPLSTIWQYLSIPLINDHIFWEKISSFRQLKIVRNADTWHLETTDKKKIDLPPDIAEWEKSGNEHPSLLDQIHHTIVAFSTLSVEESNIVFNQYEPQDQQTTASSLFIRERLHFAIAIPYYGKVNEIIIAQSPIRTVNRLHPLIHEYIKGSKNDNLNEFISSIIFLIMYRLHSGNLQASLNKPDRWMKHTAHKYFAIDWSKYTNPLLKPPYKIWLETDEVIEISEKDFEFWREVKIAKEIL